MKKAIIVVCLLLSSFFLNAIPLNITIGSGVRASTVKEATATFNIGIEVNNFNIYIEQLGLTSTKLATSYLVSNNKTLRQEFLLINDYTYNTGFYSLFDYFIGQDFITQYFYFRYRIGVQGGLNYPKEATSIQFTISPNLLLDTGITIKGFTLGIQGSGGYLKDASLQTLPIVTPYMSYDFPSIFIKLEADFKYVNYTYDRIPDLASASGRFSCTIKGEKK